MKRKLILYYISQTVFVVIIPTSPHADQLSVSEYRVSLLDLFFNNKNNNKKKTPEDVLSCHILYAEVSSQFKCQWICEEF